MLKLPARAIWNRRCGRGGFCRRHSVVWADLAQNEREEEEERDRGGGLGVALSRWQAVWDACRREVLRALARQGGGRATADAWRVTMVSRGRA